MNDSTEDFEKRFNQKPGYIYCPYIPVVRNYPSPAYSWNSWRITAASDDDPDPLDEFLEAICDLEDSFEKELEDLIEEDVGGEEEDLQDAYDRAMRGL